MRNGPEGTVPGYCHREGHAEMEEEVHRARGWAPAPWSWTEFMATLWPWGQANVCVPGMYLQEGS